MTRIKLLRILYLMVAGAAFAWLLATRWNDVSAVIRGARPAWLAAALVASFGLLGWGAWIWVRVLAALGTDVAFGTVAHATARSVLARYIPGSVWFALGRLTLLRRAGVPAPPLALTATVDMAMSVGVTIGVGALVLGVRDSLPGGAVWAIGAAFVIIVVAAPPIGGRALAVIAARRNAQMDRLSWRSYLNVLGAVALFWAWSAATFSLYVRAFPAADGFDLPSIVGGFLFSWGVGFLAFVAPQGIGVFEVTLASVLADDAIATTALLIGGYRVVILIRDAVATAAAEVIASRRAGRAPARTD